MKVLRTADKFFIIGFLFLSLHGFSQSEWKNWSSIGLDIGLSKKTDIGVSHLRSYNLDNNFKNTFKQWNVKVDHDLTRRFSLRAGIILTKLVNDSISTNRFIVRGTYKTPILNIINWSNSLQGELHSPTQTRYNYRIIYMTRLAPKKRVGPLKLSPSVSYWLYYNLGGNAIQYYDETGSPLTLETPDGLHRGRFILSLNSKISKYLDLSLYYLNQHEFNLAGKDMNVIDPNTGKVERPFSNFNVAGVSLSLSFDAYKKKGKKKSNKLKK